MIPTANALKALTDKAIKDFHKDLEKQAEDFLNSSEVLEEFLHRAHSRNYDIQFEFKGEKYWLLPYVREKVEALGYHTAVLGQTDLRIMWGDRK